MYDFKGVQRCAPLEISESQKIEAGTVKGNKKDSLIDEKEEVDNDSEVNEV
jgi:hypothetical protein